MAPGSLGTLNYGYDPSGNLTTLPDGSAGTYDNASELTSAAGGTTTNFTYDANGDRADATQGGTTVMSAAYDGALRLSSYDLPSASVDMTSATYDGDGWRQSNTVFASGTPTTTSFTWDAASSVPHVLMDSTNAYIYAGSNTPLEEFNLSTGALTYLIADSLGSVRGAVDSTGSLTGQTAYDAWGNPETLGGLTAATPFGFAGSYTDATGLLYLINRYYDPATGQFITVDPRVADSDQPYSYANNNPVNEDDPTGLLTIGDCVGAQAQIPIVDIGGTASGCLTRVIGGHDEIGVVGTAGGGPAAGWGGVAYGAYYEVSNAASVSDMGGAFLFITTSVDLGFGGSAVVFWNPNLSVIGVGLGVSFGAGQINETGLTWSWTYTFHHFWETIPAKAAWDTHTPFGMAADVPGLLNWAKIIIGKHLSGSHDTYCPVT